ncbi:MAG: N-formylglutamate deformylase [Alteromonadaceae bacterium]|jgi:N-formylglutamate deformylase
MHPTTSEPSASPFKLFMPDELSVPILISIPHCGTLLTDEFSRNGASADILDVPDTDWFVHELYDFANELNIPLIHAVYSRYIVDLNRPLPGGAALYANTERTTGLVPLKTFAGKPIYKPGYEPSAAQINQRAEHYHKPYYAKITEVLSQLQNKFGAALLYDGHSILGQVEAIQNVPFLDYMPANRSGLTCPDAFIDKARQIIEDNGATCVANGPFQGGNITRRFHDADESIYSFQMEISQRIYMDEQSGKKCEPNWSKTVIILRQIIESFSAMMLSIAADKK